ncbi:MAG TPA: NAD-dependent deacylase [Aggregatilineales bacterium]|nr:NAD-dependent deacylase [Aggregatilineales bacterium]
MDELIQITAKKIAAAQKVVVLTGAGISKESGVPTFRDALDGLWAKYNPQELATPQAFQRNPKLVWDWYTFRRELVAKTEPNPGHYALAELEKLVPKLVLVTQNVDHHHQRAGSTDIIALHGDLFAFKCSANCRGVPTSIDITGLTWEPENAPPHCPCCETGLVRPDIVWFGEQLPEGSLRRAYDEAKTCNVALVIGTSGAVYPAAWIPIKAAEAYAFVVEINPYDTELSTMMDVRLQAPSGEVLPNLVEAVRKELAST